MNRMLLVWTISLDVIDTAAYVTLLGSLTTRPVVESDTVGTRSRHLNGCQPFSVHLSTIVPQR